MTLDRIKAFSAKVDQAFRDRVGIHVWDIVGDWQSADAFEAELHPVNDLAEIFEDYIAPWCDYSDALEFVRERLS